MIKIYKITTNIMTEEKIDVVYRTDKDGNQMAYFTVNESEVNVSLRSKEAVQIIILDLLGESVISDDVFSNLSKKVSSESFNLSKERDSSYLDSSKHIHNVIELILIKRRLMV